MKKAFDQNVSRAKPRLKLGAPAPDPSASESRTADEAWVYEVAAQVAGQPEIAEADAPTAREVMAAAAATVLEEELSARDRVEATLREAAAARAVVEEEQVTVAVQRLSLRGGEAFTPATHRPILRPPPRGRKRLTGSSGAAIAAPGGARRAMSRAGNGGGEASGVLNEGAPAAAWLGPRPAPPMSGSHRGIPGHPTGGAAALRRTSCMAGRPR